VASSFAEFEAAIWVKLMHIRKSCLKFIEKEQNMKIKEILHKYPFIR